MLIGHDIVLVFRVDGLVVRRHVDFVIRQPRVWRAEVLEEVRVPRCVEVDVGVAGVLVLWRGSCSWLEGRSWVLFLFLFWESQRTENKQTNHCGGWVSLHTCKPACPPGTRVSDFDSRSKLLAC